MPIFWRRRSRKSWARPRCERAKARASGSCASGWRPRSSTGVGSTRARRRRSSLSSPQRTGWWASRVMPGTGKTTMLDRFRSLAESAGYRVRGLASSASTARTLGRESGIRSETLQRYLTRHAGQRPGVFGSCARRRPGPATVRISSRTIRNSSPINWERATGERVAALDAVAERAVLQTEKQDELTLETHDERSWKVGNVLDRGHEAEGIEVGEPRIGHETGMKSPDRDEERTQEFPDSGQLDQELGGERSEESGPESESEQEKTHTGTNKPRDFRRLAPAGA